MIRVRKPRDPRIKALASALGISREEALGRLIDLWEQCLEEGSDSLVPIFINTHLKSERGVDALVSSGLGRIAPGAIQVAGARDEIAQRERRSESARRAGIASGVVRGGTTPQTNERDVHATSTPGQPDVNATSTAGERPLFSSSDLGSDLSPSGASDLSSKTPRDLKQKRGKRSMPLDFAPNESDRTLAASLRLDADAELEKCRDYYAANGKHMADWRATYRNWLRNAAQYRKPPYHASERSHGSAAAFDLAMEAEERERTRRTS